MASNPALKQLWLVPFAVIPGILAYLRILTSNQAGLCIIALYLVSRWHASKIQKDFDARHPSSSSPSSSSARAPTSATPPLPRSSSKSSKQKPSKKSA